MEPTPTATTTGTLRPPSGRQQRLDPLHHRGNGGLRLLASKHCKLHFLHEDSLRARRLGKRRQRNAGAFQGLGLDRSQRLRRGEIDVMVGTQMITASTSFTRLKSVEAENRPAFNSV